MKLARILPLLLPLLLIAGCCKPGGKRVDLARAATPRGSTRHEPTVIAIAPILRGAAWTGGPRGAGALLLTAPGAQFSTADLAPLGSPGVTYPRAPGDWQEISLPPAALTRIVETMLADPRFAGKQLTPNSALSVRVLHRDRGCMVIAEVFIDLGTVFDFAARLTEAGMGTDALRPLLQWEMNL
jgi:hypothetical protein